ncbi:hypothetical protein CFC21_106082, partial [Triticum aestivum]
DQSTGEKTVHLVLDWHIMPNAGAMIRARCLSRSLICQIPILP